MAADRIPEKELSWRAAGGYALRRKYLAAAELLVGSKYNRLTILSVEHETVNGRIRVVCRCDCGNEKSLPLAIVKRGDVTGCGCRITMKTHGASRTPEYKSWSHMKDRCEKTSCKEYEYYGARGISVCERWQSFDNFLADMGPRPGPGYGLDRYPNNDGNYEPGNVRWATQRQQNQNTRANHIISYRGETHTLTEWARRSNLKKGTLWSRLKAGWTIKRALLTKPRKRQ